jgi:hypothetical protein
MDMGRAASGLARIRVISKELKKEEVALIAPHIHQNGEGRCFILHPD